MPSTYTGRLVKPGNGQHPSLLDIAVGLSRQPRFAGQTRRWWSVLDHVLFGDELIQQADPAEYVIAPEQVPLWRRAWLLHDAHEAVTADVPTDVKGDDLHRAQDQLDERIFDAFFPGGYPASLDWKDDVKRIDRLCLIAEARVIGPPMSAERVTFHFGAVDGSAGAAVWLEQILDPYEPRSEYRYLGQPPTALRPEVHPAVRQYLTRLERLL